MKKEHILINEMFPSVQGEGAYVGTPMLFIRTSTCNLRCTWCDQPDSVAEGFRGTKLKYEKMTPDDIMGWVREQLDFRYVCITGGEPTLQDLMPLVDRLRNHDYKIHVETNGTRAPDWVYKVDHICLSPKRDSQIHDDMWNLASEVKIIIDSDSKFSDVQAVLDRVDDGKPVYLQPANHMDTLNPDNVAKALRFVHQDPWQLRLSLQMHKVLGVH